MFAMEPVSASEILTLTPSQCQACVITCTAECSKFQIIDFYKWGSVQFSVFQSNGWNMFVSVSVDNKEGGVPRYDSHIL